MTCVVVELRRPRRPRWLALAAALALLALAARPTLAVVETPANARRKGGRKPRS